MTETLLCVRRLTARCVQSDLNPAAEQVPAYLLGNNYTVTKASGAQNWLVASQRRCGSDPGGLLRRRERQELRAEALVRHDGRADFQTHRRAWCASPFCLFKHVANENVCGAAAVKSYPYKELAEWVQGATMIMHLKKSEKKEMISCA